MHNVAPEPVHDDPVAELLRVVDFVARLSVASPCAADCDCVSELCLPSDCGGLPCRLIRHRGTGWSWFAPGVIPGSEPAEPTRTRVEQKARIRPAGDGRGSSA